MVTENTILVPRRRQAPAAFLAAVAFLVAPGALAAQNTGKITGKIIDSATRQPIPKVHVASTTGGPSGQFVGSLTGPDGAYTLEDVPAGSIQMIVNLDGYKLITERSEPSAAFSLAPGDTVRRDFAMHPQSSISGRLVDRDTGKGITGHTVSAVRKEAVPGHTFFIPRAGEQNGDAFNIKNLEPGDYLLQIDPKEDAAFVFPADASPKPAAKKCYGVSWYPDASSIDAAVSIHLGEGENRRVEISLHSRETHSISGVLKAPRELSGQPLTFTLQTGDGPLNGWVAEMPAPGSFRIDNLAPGHYRVGLTGGKPTTDTASFRDYVLFNLDRGPVEKPAVNAVGDYVFEIDDKDIDNFNISLLPYAGVTGEVRMLEKDAKLPAKLGVTLMPTADYLIDLKTGGAIGGGPMTIRGSSVDAQTGRFRQEWLHPSEYWPQLNGLPDGYAVAQVLFDGASPRNTTMTLAAPDTPLTFIVTSRAGALAGTVRDDQGTVRGAHVLLLPDPLPDKLGPEIIRTEDSGEGGSFAFRNLAPGRYRALVLADAELASEGDPEYLRQRVGGEVIEVAAGQTARVDLKK